MRIGSHSWKACIAAARRALKLPLLGSCALAPSRQMPLIRSWSSQTAITGMAACMDLEVDVAAVEGVTLPVVLQRDQFAVGFPVAAEQARGEFEAAAEVGFVDVVAEQHRGVDVAAPGRIGIGVELADRVGGARHHRKPHLANRTRRQGLGAPDR